VLTKALQGLLNYQSPVESDPGMESHIAATCIHPRLWFFIFLVRFGSVIRFGFFPTHGFDQRALNIFLFFFLIFFLFLYDRFLGFLFRHCQAPANSPPFDSLSHNLYQFLDFSPLSLNPFLSLFKVIFFYFCVIFSYATFFWALSFFFYSKFNFAILNQLVWTCLVHHQFEFYILILVSLC